MTHEQISHKIVTALHVAYPDASIGVGGSVAEGTYREDSDIDILFLREGQTESYSVSFVYEGIDISIFSFSMSFFNSNDRKYLYTYHNMPITFISGVSVLYDEKRLIEEIRKIVDNLLERRSFLRELLIKDLKNGIEKLFNFQSQSVLERKRIYYDIIHSIVYIFFLKKYPDKIINKQYGRNPFTIIASEDYYLYVNLKMCGCYTSFSFSKLKSLFENHILTNY
ncbi:hypothetical protein DW182_18380 [Bacteroides sp. AM16-24]|jgi:hypothetical protein|uniref:nucleotidyltransferase domain-containing protein n=1 Tax=Bacteroides sp. AM16-24 TaxID=2292002 RepID=UPI000E475E46|nr:MULTISPECIES: nucleotidyltransferase domain-containing protein [Bacteroides]RHI02864.1 hypothetical protein DW182_18380 [Bacteroides sp. AM16-24]